MCCTSCRAGVHCFNSSQPFDSLLYVVHTYLLRHLYICIILFKRNEKYCSVVYCHNQSCGWREMRRSLQCGIRMYVLPFIWCVCITNPSMASCHMHTYSAELAMGVACLPMYTAWWTGGQTVACAHPCTPPLFAVQAAACAQCGANFPTTYYACSYPFTGSHSHVSFTFWEAAVTPSLNFLPSLPSPTCAGQWKATPAFKGRVSGPVLCTCTSPPHQCMPASEDLCRNA